MEYLDLVRSLLSLTIPTFSFTAIAPNALFLNIMEVYGSSNCVGDEDNYDNKVNRCLARYSPRATTTNRPTNRALNKPAWPGPN